MKTRLLLFAVSVVLLMTTAQAAAIFENQYDENVKGTSIGYRNSQPVLFQFKGVDYAVYPDGRLQYELPQRTFYRSTRWNNRRSQVRFRNRNNRLIGYNRQGLVSRIGNTRISYFPNGQVARIGYLRMDYHGRYGSLKQVGGLEVRYNHRGELVAARGCVNNRSVNGRLPDCRFQEFGSFQEPDQNDWDDGVFFKKHPIK